MLTTVPADIYYLWFPRDNLATKALGTRASLCAHMMFQFDALTQPRADT